MPYVEISPEEAISTQGKFIPISEEEALKAKKPTSPLTEGMSKAYETTKAMGTVWGPAEVGAELVSGLPGFVAGGITSGIEAVSGKKIPYANKLVELLESPYVTYKPKTESGKQLENALANIFITARETGQNVGDVVLEKTGSPLLSTIAGTATGGIPEILMGIVGIKRGLRPKVKAPTFPTEADWAELKRPSPEQLEYKPKVEPRTLEVPPELQTKALPPGQGFIILDEPPKTILRQPPPLRGKPVEISPEGEPIYPEGVKPVLGKLPLTETEKMKAPIITKEGETIGVRPEVKAIEQPKVEVAPPEAKVEALKPEPFPIEKVSPEAPSVKAEQKRVQPGLGILKSETGAIQFPTVEEIKRATNRFREFWEPLSTLPQREKILKDRGWAFGSQARVDRMVDHVIDLTKGFSDQAKKEMFEASDRSRRDINTLPPEQARVVKELITVKNIIGDGLVLRDMVPEEAVGKLKGQYIKFVYLKHLLGENVEIPIGSNAKINTNALKARKGLTLEQQKGIGLIEDISIADPLGMAQSLSNIVKYDYLEKLASDPRNVWEPSIINIADMPRKYSERIGKAQATRLSRTTGDPHRAIQVGNDWQVMNLQNREFVGKKMGIGELNEEVELYKKMVKANPNSPEIKQRLDIYERYLEQAKVATQNIPEDFIQMPTAKSWGPLAGTFIRKEVARDLMSFYGKERGNIQGLTKTIDALVDLDQKATGIFKIGKVPLNLPTVVRNTISNPIQLNMSGMNFADIIKNMVRTGEDFIKKSPTFTKASRAGLFKTNFSVTEINEVMDQFRHLKGDTFADVLGAVKNLSKYYGRIDDFFKYTKLLDGLDNGLSFDKSMIEAQKWVMDYSLADPSIKWARKHFIPFASYQYKIAPLVVESAIKRPWVIAKYMALPPAIMALSKELYKDEMTEDDWKTLESSIPREVQRRQSFLIVPWKIEGKWYWFDYSYFLPWGNYMNAISAVSSGDIKAPLTQFGIGGTPVLTALKTFSSSAMRNEPPKDSFSGYPLYNRLDEPIDKALKVSEYFYNLFAPSMVTRYGALGETLDIGKEDRYGRTVEAEQAIGKWFGVNLKEANPKLAAIVKKAKINALKDEYMKIMIDLNISSEKKEGYAERFQEEINQIMKGKD